MAQTNRKSQAEKAVRASKQKNDSSKSTGKKKAPQDTQTSFDLNRGSAFPVRYLLAVVCFILFVVLLVVQLNPQGALVTLLGDFLRGLVGHVGYLVLIPVMLLLCFILGFSGNRPVVMRSVCALFFAFLCGCISHLVMSPDFTENVWENVVFLYQGGISGTAGGVLCGGLTVAMVWLCGPVITYIIFILCAILTLLASLEITIPSLIQAIHDRPRGDWELEEKESEPPAAKVVNSIAKKRIQYVEQKRAQRPKPVPEETSKAKPQHGSEIMGQLEEEVDKPLHGNRVQPDPEQEEEILTEQAKPAKKKPEPIRKSVTAEPEPELQPEPEVQSDPEPLPVTPEIQEAVAKQKVTAKDAEEAAAEIATAIAQEEEQAAAEEKPVYHYPPIDLLKLPTRGGGDGTLEMKENSRRLNETLASFKIEAHIVNVTRGPSVTRYEVELERGVRLSKLTSAADDIALNLGASGVRIAAVPDKISVVGIEVPNKAVTTVSLREVIDSNAFASASSKSSFAVGKDIGGKCIVGNIAKLPHMLIAGTTGSGKSVCMNSIIISLLYKASPEDVKLIMVDPKMVELGIYNGIPHLLIPVVTDPKKAAGSLQWAVTEMMRRYKAMSDAGVRDLESYNSMIENEEIDGQKLPQVVVIIDELADLMLVAAKEVEESICRIAQMGRASGIHLIIATQRPSADVITGLMKANIPSRIAFAVASAMESRIILDTQGAEKLVGRGDMLFAPIGTGKPQRVQGCFVSDPEVEAVATYVKNNYTTHYDESVMDEIERKAAQTGSSKTAASDPEPCADELEGDEMLPQAVDVILETGQASVSMLQRRLKLGYARAARIVDEMEEKGIVGPFQGSKPRTILITKEQWAAMKGGQPAQMNFEDLSPEEIQEGEDPQ